MALVVNVAVHIPGRSGLCHDGCAHFLTASAPVSTARKPKKMRRGWRSKEEETEEEEEEEEEERIFAKF
jgi:ribosomal protein L12E/L44/L45/RPP1/RPP2